mgnify:CR=1 FL=1
MLNPSSIPFHGARRFVGIGVLLIFAGWPTFGQTPKMEGALEPFLREPSLTIQPLFDSERFPNIIVTTKGTVLTTWGNKRIQVRRSEDGGVTWNEPMTIADPGFQGGGTTVDETSGDILAFVEAHHPPAELTLFRSRDDVKTFSKYKLTLKPD